MSSPIEIVPAHKDRHDRCGVNPADPHLQALAHDSMMANPQLFNVAPPAGHIRLDAWLALQGSPEGMKALVGDLQSLAKRPYEETPVLEYLAHPETTRFLPTARVQFDGKSNKIDSITFDQGCTNDDAKFREIRIQHQP